MEGPRRGRSRELALLALSLAVALGLAELLVRVFDLGPRIRPVWHGNFRFSDNPVLRYELEPLSRDGEFRINRDGMRDREYPAEKPAHTFRVAVLGDSIAFGLDVPQDRAFPAQLEALLSAYYADPGRRFEVLNFGVIGYGIPQVVEVLRSRALAYQPDLVLYAYCLNDPQEYSLELAGLVSEMTEARQGYARALSEGAGHLLERSRLYLLLRYWIATRRRPPEHPDPARDDPQFQALREGRLPEYVTALHSPGPAWDRVREGFAALSALSRERGIPVHVVVFPLLDELEGYPLRSVHAQLAAEAARHSLPVLDLLPAFGLFERQREREIGIEVLHPTDEGHAFTALAVLLHLLESRALPGLEAADFRRVLEARRPESALGRIAVRARRGRVR